MAIPWWSSLENWHFYSGPGSTLGWRNEIPEAVCCGKSKQTRIPKKITPKTKKSRVI